MDGMSGNVQTELGTWGGGEMRSPMSETRKENSRKYPKVAERRNMKQEEDDNCITSVLEGQPFYDA